MDEIIKEDSVQFFKKQVKPTEQYLLHIKDKLQKPSEKEKHIESVLKKIYDQLQSNHICLIIAIHSSTGYDLLSKFLAKCCRKFKDEQSEPFKQLYTLYKVGYQCFFEKIETYKSIFDEFKSQNYGYFQRNQKRMDYTSVEQNKRYHELKTITEELFQLKFFKGESRTLGIKLTQFINCRIKFIRPTTGFQEVFITWLKIQVQDIQNNLFKQMSNLMERKVQSGGLCCRLHFRSMQSIPGIDPSRSIFISSNEKKKINDKENKYYIEYLKKVSVSFLNTNGGAVYIGVENDGKKCSFKGITLKEQQKKDLLLFLASEIFYEIFPIPDELQEQHNPQIQQADYLYEKKKRMLQKKRQQFSKSIKESDYEYRINKYVSIDFTPIYNPQTFLSSRSEGLCEYVMRIKISTGSCYEMYHFINDKDTPTAYVRQGKKQKQLPFSEFYSRVYQKLKEKKRNKGEQPSFKNYHQFCRLKQSGIKPEQVTAPTKQQ